MVCQEVEEVYFELKREREPLFVEIYCEQERTTGYTRGNLFQREADFGEQGKFVGVSVERTTGSFVYQLSLKRVIDGKFGIEKQGYKSVWVASNN